MHRHFRGGGLRGFARDDRASITVLSLILFLVALMIGGLAIDYSNAIEARTHLQVTADAAAHAAIYTRERGSEAEARKVALQVAARNMPPRKFGQVLDAEDISFGTWNSEKQVFTEALGSREAVFVSTKRRAANSNGVGTFFLNLIGRNNWDVTSGTVFEAYLPPCFREGFVGDGEVKIESNNAFPTGFCIHSNERVRVRTNNIFDLGAVVSMPDKRDIAKPAAGFSSNHGLEEALRDASYQMRIVNRLDEIAAGVQKNGTDYSRDYVTDNAPIRIDPTEGVTALNTYPGRVHVVSCVGGGGRVEIAADAVLVDAVLVTNCRIEIMANAVIEDAVIVTTSTEKQSVYSSEPVVLGRDDDCEPGGDVQILAKGGVDLHGEVSMYGSQIVAAGNVSLAAAASEFEGVSVIAGGRIDVDSKGGFGFCGGKGLENSFEASYFRLAG